MTLLAFHHSGAVSGAFLMFLFFVITLAFVALLARGGGK
jgi:hypothetical protein